MPLSGSVKASSTGGGGGSGAAAIVVAASDSPSYAKQVASYVCDGVNDDVQIQAAIDDLLANRGGTVELAPGTFNTSTQIYLNDQNQRIHLSGYGARIVTSGAIWAITLETTGAPISPNTISGLTIYQQGDADALGGIRMLGAPNTILRDITVVADSTPTNYVACILAARDANNDGPYWSTIQNVWIRKDAGGNGSIPVGIYLRDNANAIRIISGGINNCTDAILCDGDEETGIDLDSLTVIGTAFESCTDAIELNGATDTNGGAGIKIIGCRAEATTNFLHVNGRGSTGYVEAPQLIGNWKSASVTNYVTFTGTSGAGQEYMSLDMNAPTGGIWQNDSPVLYIDSSGNVGIGGLDNTDTIGGQLHVQKAASGATAASNAQTGVFEGTGNEGLSILTPNDRQGAIYFGDSDDNNVGMFIYDHATNAYSIYGNASLVATIDSSGDVGFGTASPGGAVHVQKAATGGSANSNAATGVFEGAGNEGISILTPNTAQGAVYFGDSNDDNVGMFIYNHSTNKFTTYANATLSLTIGDDGLVIPTKTDANRGAAGTAGRMIFNSDDSQLNIDTGSAWTLPDGTVT